MAERRCVSLRHLTARMSSPPLPTLKNRIMLAIDRQNMRTASLSLSHYQPTSRHQCLFIGKSNGLPGLYCRQYRGQTSNTNNAGHDNINSHSGNF